MSANKKIPKGITELTGKVVVKKFGLGSKSEHDAVCLQTSKGEYVLRQVGGNPFENDAFQEMVGKQIIASGIISDYIFFARTIREI